MVSRYSVYMAYIRVLELKLFEFTDLYLLKIFLTKNTRKIIQISS